MVGIIKLPLDGNPNNTIGLIAHSNKITSINSTVDGKLFFTSGADDFCVNIWEVDFAALEENFYGNYSLMKFLKVKIPSLNCLKEAQPARLCQT